MEENPSDKRSKIIKFTISSIEMMIFTSIYSIVDGLFTSNFAGKIPFAAINLIMPLVMLFSGFGFMFGTGGSALVSRFLGEGKSEKANKIFSFIVYFSIAFGIVMSVIFYFVIPSAARLLGAKDDILHYSILYARTLSFGITAFMLQGIFQSFMIAAEKPHLGFMLLASEFAAGILASIFTSYDKELFELTKFAFRIYSVVFLFCGFNIYGSSFFIALNNGVISAVLAFVRTLIFQVACIFLFPVIFNSDGIWIASPASEILSVILTVICFIVFRKRYKY